MSRFNTKTPSTKTTNLAGGEAFKQSPKLELVSILLTSFVKDQYYRTADQTIEQVKGLIDSLDPKFVARAAIYARKKFGMRSISHVIAGELATRASGTDWGKYFYDQVVFRPDDMTEILGYYRSISGKQHPTGAMKRGFGSAMGRFDTYQFAKYRNEGKAISLVDMVNMVHPDPTEKNREALRMLVDGTLKNKDTWEAKLTQAGKAETKEEVSEQKTQAWEILLREKKLGYIALLKNVRNILEQAPNCLDLLCESLVNRKAIQGSKVFPFSFLTAIKEIKKLYIDGTRKVLDALNVAVDLSLGNIPRFDGKTLIVLDVSGSMSSQKSGTMTCAEVGALFAMSLYKANPDSDFMRFGNDAEYSTPNASDSLLTLAESVSFSSGGTDFHSIFRKANKAYDRMIILSDMQGWIGYNNPQSTFNSYCKMYSCRPKIYSFDLSGYGDMQFPENNVYCIAGFSQKTFELMGKLETDRNAMVKEIEKIRL